VKFHLPFRANLASTQLCALLRILPYAAVPNRQSNFLRETIWRLPFVIYCFIFDLFRCDFCFATHISLQSLGDFNGVMLAVKGKIVFKESYKHTWRSNNSIIKGVS